MTPEQFQQKLKELDACESAREWAEGKSWKEVYDTCHRGDWLCWLFKKTNPDDLRLLTLVKGHQANTVRHLMKNKKSIAAVDAAILFGEGRLSRIELNAAADTAAAAADAAATATTAAYAAYAAATAAYAAYHAAAADTADTAAYHADTAAAAAARKQNQQLTADIVRKFITIENFNL